MHQKRRRTPRLELVGALCIVVVGIGFGASRYLPTIVNSPAPRATSTSTLPTSQQTALARSQMLSASFAVACATAFTLHGHNAAFCHASTPTPAP